ncbi:hypothetical protein [Demequina sp.]|uniref:hypothetical protein n=1 Tax=Demequina sp. TaxID=2050685 RepID=UPI003D14A368
MSTIEDHRPAWVRRKEDEAADHWPEATNIPAWATEVCVCGPHNDVSMRRRLGQVNEMCGRIELFAEFEPGEEVVQLVICVDGERALSFDTRSELEGMLKALTSVADEWESFEAPTL